MQVENVLIYQEQMICYMHWYDHHHYKDSPANLGGLEV